MLSNYKKKRIKNNKKINCNKHMKIILFIKLIITCNRSGKYLILLSGN